jgi:hypothetical protein
MRIALPFVSATFSVACLMLDTVAYAQKSMNEHKIEHSPISAITPADRSPKPMAGPHKESSHSPMMRGVTESVSQQGCDYLAQRFVASVNHMAFIRECWASHHRILTHVTPEKSSK